MEEEQGSGRAVGADPPDLVSGQGVWEWHPPQIGWQGNGVLRVQPEGRKNHMI